MRKSNCAMALASIIAAVSPQAALSAPPVIGGLDLSLVQDDETGVGGGAAEMAKAPQVVVAKAAFVHPDWEGWWNEPTDEERIMVEAAMFRCSRSGSRRASPFAILALIQMAKDNGIVGSEAMILPAIWCRESSYGWGDEIRGDGGNSHGPLQLQEILSGECGDGDRDDLLYAARCWIFNIDRVGDKVERICGKRDFLTAEAWVAGGMRYAPSCKARSSHASELGEWEDFAKMLARSAESENRQCQIGPL